MLRVGLTGGIGSGKSTVAALFAGHHVPLIDADEISRHLVGRGQIAHDMIIKTFGTEVLHANGEIDRARLRERVFGNAADRALLEAIIHPLVRKEIEARLPQLRAPYCVIVIPLLVEANLADLVDRVLVVDCSESQQIERVRARNGLSENQIQHIMAAQVGRAERLRHADDVISNNGDREQLAVLVDQLHNRYLGLSKSPPA